jgi:hypothetical protein
VKGGKKNNYKASSEKSILNEKEDELLRLVTFSFIQILLKEDSPDR